MNINDLPNELLDEILSYVQPEIDREPIIPIKTVCRRWNRPFMSQILWNTRLPKSIDLQEKFPKLTCFKHRLFAKHLKDLSFFKGHAFLKKLCLHNIGLVASVLNCPRLTSLYLLITPERFFKDENLETFVTLLPSLESLNVRVCSHPESNPEQVESYNQKLATILQRRPRKQLKLKLIITRIDHMDFILFCELFQTSPLDHFEIYNKSLTPKQLRKCLEFFPKIRFLGFWGVYIISLTNINFDHIACLKLRGNHALSLSSVLNQFPNLESLDGGYVVFDLKVFTRLNHSRMAFIGTVQPRLFPFLKTLDWIIDPNQFNIVMQELGKHCPHLTAIKLDRNFSKTDWIVPKLNNITFPLLVNLELDTSTLYFNASLARFLARHGQLTSLEFRNTVTFDNNWKPIESDHVVWPHLRRLIFLHIQDHKSNQEILDWFVKNAPNLKDLVYRENWIFPNS